MEELDGEPTVTVRALGGGWLALAVWGLRLLRNSRLVCYHAGCTSLSLD